MLNNLRRGHQEATRVTFNNIRFKQDLAERLAGQLMIGEDDLLPLLADSVYCASLGFTPETILALFIPNTYEVYWNISAEKLMQRMQREYKNFWSDTRLAKAKAIGMTPVEVAILASIVEEETGCHRRISYRGRSVSQSFAAWYSPSGRSDREVCCGRFLSPAHPV